MRKRIGTIVVAGALGLAGAAVLSPGAAIGATNATNAADSATAADPANDSRLPALQDALAGLVTDGTLTQEQAEKVATTLQESLPQRLPGGQRPHGGRLDREAMASALGIPVPELRAGLRSGRTLAQLAEDNDVAKDDLIDRLAAASEAQLVEDVAAGRLTQDQADNRQADLLQKMTEKVNRVNKAGPDRRDERGQDATPTPSAAPS